MKAGIELLEEIYADWTGMELSFNSANLWEMEDGLARRVRLYVHREDALRELGLDDA